MRGQTLLVLVLLFAFDPTPALSTPWSKSLDSLGDHEGQPAGLCVLVELHDHTGLSEKFLHMVRAEVDRIFARSELNVLWPDAVGTSYTLSDKPYAARVFIHAHLAEPFERHKKHMAYVVTGSGESPGVSVYISRESVEENIGFKRHHFPPKLARALGRVMAHELSHRFLQRGSHTKFGILKKGWSRDELTQILPKGIFLTQEQSRFIRSYAPTLEEVRAWFSRATK